MKYYLSAFTAAFLAATTAFAAPVKLTDEQLGDTTAAGHRHQSASNLVSTTFNVTQLNDGPITAVAACGPCKAGSVSAIAIGNLSIINNFFFNSHSRH
jgi:hypothetical protein